MPEIDKKEKDDNNNTITQMVRNWSSQILSKLNEKVSETETEEMELEHLVLIETITNT
jgi:hypothetical protein